MIFIHKKGKAKWNLDKGFGSLVTLLLLVICMNSKAFSQIENPRKLSVQVYTGGPSLLKLAFDISSGYQDKVTYSGLPGVGGEIAYRFNRWFSVGGDFFYRYGHLDMKVDDIQFYNELKEKWGIQLNGIDPLGDYRLELPRYRATINAYVHALNTTSSSDLYLSLGFGMNKLTPTLYKDEQKVEITEQLGTISLPFAYRFALGYAYNFTPMIGLFTEVGIGGPVFAFGLNARF
ncbi:MAG: hypothetical protein RIT43_653 [Bacteroidota bacterium]